jgi:hypothetical protein
MSAPTVLVDGVLIVREGCRRLLWSGQGCTWKLIGMWPDPDHDELTSAHLVADRPVLVVLDSEPACVPVLREELAVPDALLQQLGLLGESEAYDDYLDAQVPFLDWLPPHQREIGQQFAGRSADVIRRTPAALLPAMLLDEHDAGDGHVRFGRLTPGHDGLSPHQLQGVAEHAFSSHAPVGAPC